MLNALFLSAQVPNSFNYQAVLRDSGVIISNQNVGIQISLIQGSPTGTTIYSETFSETTSDLGLINVQVGTGTSSDDFTQIDWVLRIIFHRNSS